MKSSFSLFVQSDAFLELRLRDEAVDSSIQNDAFRELRLRDKVIEQMFSSSDAFNISFDKEKVEKKRVFNSRKSWHSSVCSWKCWSFSTIRDSIKLWSIDEVKKESISNIENLLKDTLRKKDTCFRLSLLNFTEKMSSLLKSFEASRAWKNVCSQCFVFVSILKLRSISMFILENSRWVEVYERNRLC